MWLVVFITAKTDIVSFDRYFNYGATGVKTDGPVLQGKSSFKMLGLSLFCDLDCGFEFS